MRQTAAASSWHTAGAVVYRRATVTRRECHFGDVLGPDAHRRGTEPTKLLPYVPAQGNRAWSILHSQRDLSLGVPGLTTLAHRMLSSLPRACL